MSKEMYSSLLIKKQGLDYISLIFKMSISAGGKIKYLNFLASITESQLVFFLHKNIFKTRYIRPNTDLFVISNINLLAIQIFLKCKILFFQVVVLRLTIKALYYLLKPIKFLEKSRFKQQSRTENNQSSYQIKISFQNTSQTL